MLYSTFYLGQTQMAVAIPCILEIGRSFNFHPVRGAPEVIDGLINLRGKVVTIVNLGLAFEESKIEPTDESRIFIFKNNSELKEVADSDAVMERGVLLPVHHGLTKEMFERFFSTIELFIKKVASIK